MNTEIFIEFKNNKIRFRIKLAFDLLQVNEDVYLKIDDKVFFETDNINFDINQLYKKIDLLDKKIKKDFKLEETGLEKEKLYFVSSDYFLEENKIGYDFLKNKKNFKIIINTQNYKKLIKELGNGDLPNLYITFENSTDYIVYKDFCDMYFMLNDIVKFVEYYKLTPLEQILLVYDIVKANEYKKESTNETYDDSRNLNRIINNDKMVCVGFANLLSFLLTNLNFENTKVILEYKNKNVGHARNEVYLKDDFYNIEGNFFLDSTWDSKKSLDYIDNYYFFLKPINFFSKFKKDEYIISPKIFKILEKDTKEILELIENASDSELFSISFKLDSLLNRNFARHSFSNLRRKSKEETESFINDVFNKYNQNIKKSSFKNALYKVRKIEFINKMINFIPDEEYLEYVCDKYYKETPETRLLKFLGLKYEIKQENFCNKSNSIEDDIPKIKLLRILKDKSNDIPNNKYIKKM